MIRFPTSLSRHGLTRESLPRFHKDKMSVDHLPSPMSPTARRFNNLPKKNGTPYWIRTSDIPLRRRMLYPAELRAHNIFCCWSVDLLFFVIWSWRGEPLPYFLILTHLRIIYTQILSFKNGVKCLLTICGSCQAASLSRLPTVSRTHNTLNGRDTGIWTLNLRFMRPML